MALRYILQLASWSALAGTVVLLCLFLADQVALDTMKTPLLATTVVWFAATPWRMQR